MARPPTLWHSCPERFIWHRWQVLRGGIIRDCYALNCKLVDDTALEVYTSPVGGTDTQNGYYCGIVSDAAFSSVRNSTEVTAEQLASGEVTYALNRGVTDGTQGWYQTCGEGLPTHHGQTVYQTMGCGSSTVVYINDPNVSADHSYAETVTKSATCTEAGSKTFICTNCGDSYTETVSALGHSFENGSCTVCGEPDPDYVKPVVQPTLTLKAPSLEFKDMIKVIAFFTAENIESIVEMGMITFTERVDVIDINTAAHVIPGAEYEANSGRYFASSQGIHAKYLDDTVYLACYAKLTDGSYAYTKLASYSAVQYATSQLKNSDDAKLKQLVAAMLNYGAAAQNYFGYNTDNLANASMTEEQMALVESYREDMVNTVPAVDASKQGSFANNKGFSVRKPAVSFEGAFSINYFFTPAYTPANGITLYYWTEADFNANDVLTAENATGSITMTTESDGQYHGDIEGIAAKNIAKAIYVAAVYSDGTTTWTSGVLGYSIGAYCASQATKGGTIADLAMATAVYGYHAKQYFG